MPTNTSRTLRWLGLGLSSNLGARDQPHPYRLLDAHPGLFDFVEYSAPFALTEARRAAFFGELWARREEVPAVYHPVHLNLYGPQLEPAADLAAMSQHARAIGSPWVGNDVGWWHVGGEPFPGYLYLPPPLDEGGLADCVTHALHVQEAIEPPLILENPAATPAAGPMHVLDFMGRLHARTKLGLILDLGHLFAYQLAAGLPAHAGLDGFPLEAVVELHFAGGLVTRAGDRRFYVDDHTQPVREELFELLESVLPRCPNLCAVTFEGDGHPPEMAAATLRRVRALVPPRREVQVELPSPPPYEPAALRSDPWRMYRQAYGDVPATEAITEADRAFRRAVLAQRIEQRFPLTRLLAAGTPERLAAFAASDEFRALFDGSARQLAQVFATWVRRRLREEPDEATSRALSFELWVQAMPRAEGRAPSHPDELGLAPGLRVGAFPIDLSELLFAAKAVRRHLSDRAWAEGKLPLEGLEALRQAAGRAPPGPWAVAVVPGRRDVLPLGPELQLLVRHAAAAPPWEALVEACGRNAVRQALELGLVSGADAHEGAGRG